MPIRQDPWAQGIGNLGTALFGSPQDDVAISQAQNFQASRQKTMQEIQQERQRQAMLESIGDIVANYDPEQGLDAFRPAIAQAIEAGMDPAHLFEYGRGAVGVGGGGFDQFTGLTTNPQARLAIEEANRDRAQMARTQETLTEYFGPGLGALFGSGMGDLSDVERRAAVLSANNPGVSFRDAHNSLTAGGEVVTTPYGDVMRVPHPLFANQAGPRYEEIYSPGSDFVASLPPGQQAALGGGSADQGSAQPAPQAQPAPTGQQPGGQAPPPAPTGRGQAAGQPRLTDVSGENVPQTPEQALGMGSVVSPEAREAGFTGLYDLVPLASSPAGGIKRFSSKYLGGFFDRFSFPEAKGAKADMGLFNAKIRPLLTVSNRPARMELEWINDILVGHEWFSNPADDFRVLMGIEDSLKRSRDHLNQALAGNLTGAQRTELANARRLTEELLSEFGQRPEGEVSGQDIFVEEMGDFFGQVLGGNGPGDDVRRFTGRLQETFDSAQQGSNAPQVSEEDLEFFNSLPPEQQAELLGGGN